MALGMVSARRMKEKMQGQSGEAGPLRLRVRPGWLVRCRSVWRRRSVVSGHSPRPTPQLERLRLRIISATHQQSPVCVHPERLLRDSSRHR